MGGITFVTINFAANAVAARPIQSNNGLLIGRAAAIKSGVANPFHLSSSPGIDLSADYGIESTDQVYKGIQDFFTCLNGANAGLYVYVITGTGGTTESDQTLTGPLNGSNYTFYAPQCPVTSITGLEANYDSSGWMTVPGDFWAMGTGLGGKYDGRVIFKTGTVWGDSTDGIGLYYSGTTADYGFLTGAGSLAAFTKDNYSLRADVVVPELGNAFEAVKEKPFFIFSFAYNQALGTPLSVDVLESFKYASGQSYGGYGWLDDAIQGSVMASQFASAGRYCSFWMSMPDNIRESTLLGSGYAAGTTNSGYSFSSAKALIGASPRTSLWSAKQGIDASSHDIAINAMTVNLKGNPRLSMTYKEPGVFAQTVFPKRSELDGWRAVNINPVIEVQYGINPDDVTARFGGNSTLGTGNEKDINFMRCRDLLLYGIRNALQTLLLNGNLKYDLAGIDAIESTINAVMREARDVTKIIDDIGTVTIPVKTYLQKEGSLSTGDKLILAGYRASKEVKGIIVTYKWNGDIESIVIDSLGVV